MNPSKDSSITQNKILSMTGYAVIEKTFSGKTYKLHLKSVNHRFTEIRIRLARSLNSFETDARLLLPKKIIRGSCDFWSEEVNSGGQNKGLSAKNFFGQLMQAVQESKEAGGFFLPAPIRALILSRFPQYWLGEENTLEEIDKDDFLNALSELCAELEDKRAIEGLGVANALTQMLYEMSEIKNSIEKELPSIRSEWENSLRERIQKLCQDSGVPSPNEDRVLQEVLFLAEKRDVAEEIQRIGSHVTAIMDALNSPPNNFGRRLEFLLQELHREWTTLGNKIQNTDCSRKIVDAKLILEKMREQSLNLA